MTQRPAKVAGVVLTLLSVVAAAAGAASADRQGNHPKTLATTDIEGLLAGRGLGLARAAELNGYPGPLHVLELAAELDLTPEQRARTQALYDAMRERARRLGRQLIEAEARLERLFAERRATSERMQPILTDIERLRTRLRHTHLDAHLAQARLLTPEQIARYGALRGHGHAAPGQPGH